MKKKIEKIIPQKKKGKKKSLKGNKKLGDKKIRHKNYF